MYEYFDTPELDNEVLHPEEWAMLWPTIPIWVIAELCKGINEDSENGYY